MTRSIPFLDLKRLNLPYENEISRAVSGVVSSGRYIGGAVNESFEKSLAAYQDIPHVVGVSNGLDALTLILLAYIDNGRLRPGDKVLYPANTYIASVLAISRAGLVPVPVEPSAETLNMDTELMEQAITPDTRAVMIVHLYGRACWDEVLIDTVKRHGLLVIEDNAQAIGARADLKGLHGPSHMTGSLGDAAAFSFYPTKNLGAMGDAGAVATHDPLLASTVRALANYGSDRRYHNIYKGANCRLDPVQAAVLSAKLTGLDRDNERRRNIAEMYRRHLTNPDIRLYTVMPAASTNYHQLIATTPDRDSLMKHLAERGIGTDIHYAVPPHRQPCYLEDLGQYHLPVTERLADSVMSLPVAPYLSDDDIMYITEALNTWTRR